MAVKNIIAAGVGFSPGGVYYLPTLGFGTFPAVVSWGIQADFDRDDIYETNLTTRFTQINSSLTVRRGLGPDGVYHASSISGSFLNDDGELTPDYSSSSLYGQIVPGARLRIRMYLGAGAYNLWTGYINRWGFRWDALRPNAGVAEFTAGDLAALLRAINVDVADSASVLTSTAIGNILDAANLGAGDRDLDTGLQTLPHHNTSQQDALSAIADVVQAEMGGLAWVTKEGKLRFEARNSRLGVTVDDTWGDGTDIKPNEESLEFDSLDLTYDVTVEPDAPQGGDDGTTVVPPTINPTTDTPSLAAGAEREFILHYSYPVSAMITPVAYTDYMGNTAADGSGTDRTSSLTVTATDFGRAAKVKVRNDHASDLVYITKLRIRGTPIYTPPDRPTWRGRLAAQGHKTGGASIVLTIPFVGDI